MGPTKLYVQPSIGSKEVQEAVTNAFVQGGDIITLARGEIQLVICRNECTLSIKS
jgi:hypothetical protein